MSRVIVKNLPEKITKEQLSNHFSSVGQITDINLKYKDGTFRGFAFIGFESEEAASKALKFKNTYIRKNKIIVEKCLELDHEKKEKKKKEMEMEMEKSKKEDFKNALKMKDQISKEKLDALMQNPNFTEYLLINKKGTADLVDTLRKKFGKLKQEEEEQEKSEDEEMEAKNQSLANRNISDIEYLKCLIKASSDEVAQMKEKKAKKWKNLHTVVVKRVGQDIEIEQGKFSKKSLKDFFRPLTLQSLRIPRTMSYLAFVGFKMERNMKKALEKDRSFLDGYQVRVFKHESKDPSVGVPNNNEPSWKVAEAKLQKEVEPVGDSGRLFVRNLWYSVTESDIKQLFEKIGPLTDVTLPICKQTQRPKGFAHVTFLFPEHAVKAINQLDGTDFKGRILHILPSLLNEDQEDDGEGKNFKEKKKEQQKKTASSSHNWHTLFIGSETVIDLMTKKNCISKYEMLQDEEGTSAAVSMAINEAQIVEETKRTLEENGVSLDAFSNPNVQRSSQVILAKNLPANTAASELKEIFGKFGNLGRVVLPPSGVTAIIEFVNPSEAKVAFRELAYSRFKHLPLYLEWAPFEVFNSEAKKDSSKKKEKKKNDIVENRSPEENTTLYVKNLNFKTDEETLKMHFSSIGEVSSVMIAKQRMLSQGYGFVQFFKTSDADRALLVLQNSTLDGHNLLLKKSEKKLVSQTSKLARIVAKPGDPTSAKILIRNIPFQATFKEIKDLFESCGKVKLLRLPKKIGSSEHRGFGFIEYITIEEAKNAMASLGASTHLYGRRLVLEWANEDETVEQLRLKTAEKFLSSAPPKKKLKL